MATRAKRPSRRPSSEAAATAAHISELYGHIYKIVRAIPRGHVATYGQVAELAGKPGGGRIAGAAMRASVPEMGLPWHRVIGKRSRGVGVIRIHDPVGAGIQRSMLEDEGIEITDAGSIKLAEYGWLPEDGAAGAKPGKRGRAGAAGRPGKRGRRK